MTYLASVALVAVAAVLLIAGLAATSTDVLVSAALCSGLAVVLLWRRLKLQQAATEPPTVEHTAPDLDRPLRTPAHEPAVAISDYNLLLESEVLPALETLSVDELHAVILREHNGLNRIPIIERAITLIDLMLGPGSAARMLTGKH